MSDEEKRELTVIQGEKKEEKGKKPGKKKKSEKPSNAADIYYFLSKVMHQSILAHGAPPFPRRFLTYEGTGGGKMLLEEFPDQVVGVTSKETIIDAIISYTSTHFAGDDSFHLTHAKAKECYLYWRGVTPPLPMPKPFSWPGEDVRAFARLPWHPTTGAAPTWEKLLSKMSNAAAFVQWIGSLFYEQSNTHQYCYLFGAGNDGKGSINRFLKRVFGPAYCSKQPPKKDGDKFWTYGLLGKRLVVLPDCADASFIASGLFKSLTGGDPIDVEAKGKDSFTAELVCKFLFLSNVRPQLSSEQADQRRVIYCEFQRSPIEEDPEFEKRLWAEGGDFLGNCMAEYTYRNPTHGRIVTDRSGAEDVASSLELHYEAAFDERFELDPEGGVPPVALQRVLQELWPRRSDQLGFISWMERIHGIKKKRDPQSRNQKAYVGLKVRGMV